MKKTEPKKKRRGRPPEHTPTPEKIRMARAMAGMGLRRDMIAEVLGMAKSTFQTHYPEHLKDVDENRNKRIEDTLYAMATDPNHPRCATAAIFWMKCRAGWSETSNVNVNLDVGEIYRKEVEKWTKRAEVN